MAIGVFMILSVITIINFRNGQYRDELAGTAQLIEASIREMQTAAIAGTAVPCPGLAKAAPRYGFGVNITANPFQILEFADCSDSSKYVYDSTTDYLVKPVQLPSRVEVTCLQPPAGSCPPKPSDPLNVVFSPLTETVQINGTALPKQVIENLPADGYVTATLRHEITNKFMTVKINPLTGQIFSANAP